MDAPRLELLGVLRGASNYTFLARLSTVDAVPFLAVYKPAQGESPLWDFADGTLYRREVAAYRLARRLGWPRIPPTIVRPQAPHGIGALQLFIPSDRRLHFLNLPSRSDSEWAKVAVFDVVTNNADRKSGHCLVDAAGECWVVDHGLTFHTEPKLRTVIWDFAGQPLAEAARTDLEQVCCDLDEGALGAELGELLSGSELRALRQRIRSVLKPGWSFPYPDSGWSIPWPPV